MRPARFRVLARLRPGGPPRAATVTVRRDLDLITVRPLPSRRTYEFALSWAAEAVVWRVLKAELAERKAAKKKRRSA